MNNENPKNKRILIILILILIITTIINIYIVISRKQNNNSENTTQKQLIEVVKDNTSNTSQVTNTIIEKNVSNSSNTIRVDTSDTNSIVVDFTDDLDLNEVKNLMENYAVGIQRISFEEENLESNTILLFIAKQYFDSNSNKSSLEIDTNYAPSATNIHKYLSELTGKDYSNIEYIQSYGNYIGYAANSKSYIFGNDYNYITRESYRCSDISIVNEENGLYTATTDITRTLENQDTNYEVTFTFTINSNYTYEKYCIKSLKVKNTSFYPDNTVHFVEDELEEN